MIDTRTIFKERAKRFPMSPGVYLMKDSGANIIYVGKASCLRNRVGSYFVLTERLNAKTRQLVSRIADIEYFVTSSEEEALVLELNFIKQYRPHFNIALKDDKSYPYIKITVNEEWPRVLVTRRLENDGSRYFGPYGSAFSTRQTIGTIKKIFPFRSCKTIRSGANRRPCLEYDMKQCPGPCAGRVDGNEYNNTIKSLLMFLEGRHGSVISRLESEMKKAATELNYEKATVIRDRINYLNRIISYQEITQRVSGTKDAIAFAREDEDVFVQVYFIRESRIVGREGYFLKNTRHEENTSIMTSFVKQYYSHAVNVPPAILLQYPIEDKPVIKNWLRSRAGHNVNIQVPAKGAKKELIKTVASNATQGLKAGKFKNISSKTDATSLLDELRHLLNLPQLPERIEGYDISNIHGHAAVGSMVVFENATPAPSQYRRFKINTVNQPDDFSMLKEVISRRFGQKFLNSPTAGYRLPDLILIDGGKGQVSSVVESISRAGHSEISIIGLAKENEQIFLPGVSRPVALDRTSPVLHLLQNIRDEAHRFALGYHRKIRSKQSFKSRLDDVAGIGPKRKRALLNKFGSLAAVINADADELTGVKGITPEIARRIKEIV
ncbi:MAG: excinuclease ABC subunit UvrC [Dehalococcoidaceae bacterium]|nr:excinuclease ABC subunit UvrC [Dehalococcoidaceae bacterium]